MIVRSLAWFVFLLPAAIAADSPDGYHWDLPKGFPPPAVPADNPMSSAKVELGRRLFYDKRMSGNGSQSCATCHQQKLAFTDGRAQAIGTTGESHPRGAMSLVNVAYATKLTWSNPTLRSLEDQALTPMLGRQPVELGLSGHIAEFIDLLHSDPVYAALFPAAFPDEPDPFSLPNVTKALAAFERTIISARSPYDRHHYEGDDRAFPDSAKRGEILFFTDRAGCFRCHNRFNFSDGEFHNTALYNLPGLLNYPQPSLGIYEYTEKAADVGKFKTPTLRNIALTAPYMHDGSIATLDAVLDHYAAGGRGHDNPNKDPHLTGFYLTRQNRADLLAFLYSLSDMAVTRDARFSDPW